MEQLTIVASGVLICVALLHLIFTVCKSINEEYDWRIKHGWTSLWLWIISASMVTQSILYITGEI